jgi:hypothetical protein
MPILFYNNNSLNNWRSHVEFEATTRRLPVPSGVKRVPIFSFGRDNKQLRLFEEGGGKERRNRQTG